MPEQFVALSEWLAPAVPVEAKAAPVDDRCTEPIEERCKTDAIEQAMSDVRRFRAALADALDAAVSVLLRDIASEVIARELQLAPCDLQAVIERARERYSLEEPITVRAHPLEELSLRVLPVNVSTAFSRA